MNLQLFFFYNDGKSGISQTLSDLIKKINYLISYCTEYIIAKQKPRADEYHKEIYLCFSGCFVCSFKCWSFQVRVPFVLLAIFTETSI